MDHKKSAGQVYNVGSTEEISINELADKVIEMTGSKSEKRLISYEEAYGKPFDDMMRRVPSLKRIHDIVGYEPKTSLDEILRKVIDYYRSRIE